MRRTTGLLFGWLAVTTAAIALALAAVGLVTNSVTDNRPASLSAAAVADALKASNGTTGPATTSTTAPPSATTTTTTPAQSTTTRPPPRSTTTRPVPTTIATTTTTTTTSTSHSIGEHDDGSPSAPAPAEDRTYNLTGGSAAVRFEGGRVRLLWATPRPGFRLESGGDPDQVDIRFRSDTHESHLQAYWDNGPQAEIEEKQD